MMLPVLVTVLLASAVGAVHAMVYMRVVTSPRLLLLLFVVAEASAFTVVAVMSRIITQGGGHG